VAAGETEYETIIVEKERGRARITLNRPEKLNALSRQLQAELRQALWDADRDTRVHAVILRGSGTLLLCRVRPDP
jgi:enoyl-CoA hydratase